MSGPVRLQLSRRKGFSLQALSLATNGLPAVNVARPTRWGNPFVVGAMWTRRCMEPGGGTKSSGPVADAKTAMRLFRRFTARETAYGLDAYANLHGMNLACWCKLPEPGQPDICHATVLLKLANGGDK